MKKIIIFLSVLCLMVSLFTISTFAADYTIEEGSWTVSSSGLKATSYPSHLQSVSGYDIKFTANGKSYTGITFYYNQFTLKLPGASADCLYNWNTGDFGIDFEGKNTITLTVTEDTTVSADFYSWFTSVFTHGGTPQCDGTLCPARDVDHDNVCDDCGLVLVMSLRSPLLEYVYTTIDHVMENTFPDYDYWFISSSGDYYRIELSKEPFYYDSTTGSLRASSDVQSARVFESANGSFGNGGWQHYSGPFTYTPLPDIVDSSHEINFPKTPLWEEIQGVAEGQIQNKTLPRLGGTMMTLAICGISLVALVVLLVLLSKKFRIFLR